MSRVLNTADGRPVSESNPLPVKFVGGGGSNMNPDDYYTKEESDGKYQQKGSYATTAQLNNKANQSDLNELLKRVQDLEKAAEGRS